MLNGGLGLREKTTRGARKSKAIVRPSRSFVGLLASTPVYFTVIIIIILLFYFRLFTFYLHISLFFLIRLALFLLLLPSPWHR